MNAIDFARELSALGDKAMKSDEISSVEVIGILESEKLNRHRQATAMAIAQQARDIASSNGKIETIEDLQKKGLNLKLPPPPGDKA